MPQPPTNTDLLNSKSVQHYKSPKDFGAPGPHVLKMCGILDMLYQFSFRLGTYIIHVRTHVHDNLFRIVIKDGRLVASRFFENEWYLGHALSVFVQILYIHYTCYDTCP